MAELALLDPLALDREIRAASRDLRRARAAFDGGRVDDARDPFFKRRRVSSKASFDELRGLGAADPLFRALGEWAGALTIARVTFPDEEAVADAFARAEHRVAFSEEAVSARALFLGLLAEPSSSLRRPSMAAALAGALDPTRDALSRYAERRREAVRLLGADPGALDTSAVAVSADKVVRELGDALGLTKQLTFDAALDATLARDASEGWPAVLQPRWLAEIFRGLRLFEALRLELPPLPPALGGASFSRALALFGRSFAEADVPSGTPFVLARAPGDLLAPSRAALFGMIPMEPAFHRTVLGLGRERARDQARSIARSVAMTLVLDAIATLTSIALFDAPRAAPERFLDLTERTFGATWPERLATVLPRARAERPAAFAGALLAAADRSKLRDAFDDDWFRNPRAYDELRHEHRSSPALPDAAALEAGAARLVAAVREAIG